VVFKTSLRRRLRHQLLLVKVFFRVAFQEDRTIGASSFPLVVVVDATSKGKGSGS
jgi:hypothetical protein